MMLNFREWGDDRRKAVFFLHGLLGSADNWGSTAGELADAGLRCIAVDQRNHGSSFHSNEMSYPLMAQDLAGLADSLNIERFSIVGHSMGGKTAMEAALRYPSRIESAVIADIAPIQYKPAYVDYINSLKNIDLTDVRRRSDAGRQLEKYIPDRNLRMFFLTNLRKGDDGVFRWRINLEGITFNYGNIWRKIESGRSFEGPILFLRGSDSNFIQDKHLGEIEALFPNYRIRDIENSGHWVHTEQPGQFRRMLKDFLLN